MKTNTQTQIDTQFMALALKISKQALPLCQPNPPVGCVITKDHQFLTSGFTHPPGNAHAEVDALTKLFAEHPQYTQQTQQLTAYVTLEPCSFKGRTPPCAKTLIESHLFRRIVIAITDPDPRNNGRGIALLNQAGILVEVGLLASQVTPFLAPYLNR